jgi:uncharacterized protein (UPF0332 family)
MTPEAAAFLAKARSFLAKAEGMLTTWPDEAGRAAYLAGMHAAQGLIMERTGQVARTHRGVQRELLRLIKDDARFDAELRSFLGRAYNFKAMADYETGPGAIVTPERAKAAIALGHRFVARCLTVIDDP